jgi:hypothetical protein
MVSKRRTSENRRLGWRMCVAAMNNRVLLMTSRLKHFVESVPTPSIDVFCLGILLFVMALVLQALSSLPWQYSWDRTLLLFSNAMTDSYFMVMALIVIVAALSIPREVSASSFFGMQLNRPQARAFSLMLLVLGASFAMAFLQTSYSTWDYAAAPMVVFLIAIVLRERKLLKAALGLVSAVFVLALVSYVFTILKSQIFLGRTVLDTWIVAGENYLFGRPLYVLIAEWSRLHADAVRFSDWVYYLFFHHMMLVALFLFAFGNSSAQWRYVTSLALCYLLGGLIYYAFPAFGPAFFDPVNFTYLEENAKFTVFIQGLLWKSTNAAVEGKLQEVETYLFIACMPSLHMAHETIMVYFSRRAPVMLLLSVAFWLASCAAVLVLGWHYFFDIIGGILLAMLVLSYVHRRSRSVGGRPERSA